MYYPGHVKHNPDTQQVAIRTIHDFERMEWSVATSYTGSRHAPTSEVEDWEDLFVAPPPPEDAQA